MQNGASKMMVNVENFEVTEELQRVMRMQMVNKIVNEFNKYKLGTITCNKIGGKYNIIDGQHRVLALVRLGYKEIECDVYFDKTKKEEAEIFDGLSDRTSHSQFEIHRSALLREDAKAIEVYNILKNTGYEFSTKAENNKISCVKIVYDLAKINPTLLSTSLNFYKEVFGVNERNGITGIELKGIFLFLQKAITNSKFDDKHLILKLQSMTRKEILRKASSQKDANDTTSHKGYSLALLSIYNHNKTPKNRIGLDLLN